LLHYPSFANAGRHGKVFRVAPALDKRQRVSRVSGFRGAALNQSRSTSGVYTGLRCSMAVTHSINAT
ncbi:hypothetical protein FKK17_29010, partial [Klebsiella pneumoniae]|nr:hypothetical protein [Klebsiella pneumoniae]